MRYVDDDDDDELMRIIKRRRLRRAQQRQREAEDDEEDEEDVMIYRMMMEEEDLEDLEWEEVFKKQYRNTGKRPGGTNATGRVKYKESVWGLMLRRPELNDPGSTVHQMFMRRFRVPYKIFLKITDWAKGWHEKGPTDAAGHERCPTDLKVLGWLRMVGRTACFDDVEELCGIKPSTMNAFFHKFSEMGRKELFPIHVTMPTTLEKLVEIEAAYAAIGVPGACGSMDVVHIPLGACPHGLINVCTGKEGYPTLAYNVICDHSGRALSIMPSSYGTVNDKTIVKSDYAVEKVRTETLFTEYQYEVRNSSGEQTMMTGAYLIVDGGYLRWKCLQCGLRTSSDDDYVEWRMKLESIRKDIECYFGRLKQRFKILRIPNLMRTKDKIDNMMFTIVAIQNMLLDYKIAAEYGACGSMDVFLHPTPYTLHPTTPTPTPTPTPLPQTPQYRPPHQVAYRFFPPRCFSFLPLSPYKAHKLHDRERA